MGGKAKLEGEIKSFYAARGTRPTARSRRFSVRDPSPGLRELCHKAVQRGNAVFCGTHLLQ